MVRVPPDEVARVAAGVENVRLGPVRVHGEHAGLKMPPPAVRPPPVQHDEPLARRAVQQVIEIVLRPVHRRLAGPDGGGVGDAEDQFGLAGIEVDGPHAAAFGDQLVGERIFQPRVAVAGAEVVDPAEVGVEARFAVRGERIDRLRERPHPRAGLDRPRRDLLEPAHEPVAVAVVPDDFAPVARSELQHAPLLPAERRGAMNRSISVRVRPVDVADADGILRGRAAALESDLVRQHDRVVRRELQLVVIPEPVVFRAAGELSHRDLEPGRVCELW